MITPPFCEFINHIDRNALNYDLERNATERMKNPQIPFTEDQYLLIMDLIAHTSILWLSHYHKWLFEYLSHMEDNKE